MQEVERNIFMITERGAMGALMPPVNIYVLAGPNGLVFDSGYGRRAILDHLGKELERIEQTVRSRNEPFCITRALPSHSHPDHVSGLQFLRERFGISTLLTEKMAANLRPGHRKRRAAAYDGHGVGLQKKIMLRLYLSHVQPLLLGAASSISEYSTIPENGTLEINGEVWEVMPAPGHCNDHIFLYSRQRGILFSGDNIMRSITTWLGPPLSNLSDYRKTLETALSLENLKLVLSAHGSPITNPKERIERILEHREHRTGQVVSVVEKSGARGVTVDRVVKEIYRGDQSGKRNIADGWIILTLEDLCSKGIVKKRGKRFFMAD